MPFKARGLVIMSHRAYLLSFARYNDLLIKIRVFRRFCRAMLCIRAAYAVMRCPSVCLSVTFMDSVETNKHIASIFFNHRVATPF